MKNLKDLIDELFRCYVLAIQPPIFLKPDDDDHGTFDDRIEEIRETGANIPLFKNPTPDFADLARQVKSQWKLERGSQPPVEICTNPTALKAAMGIKRAINYSVYEEKLEELEASKHQLLAELEHPPGKIRLSFDDKLRVITRLDVAHQPSCGLNQRGKIYNHIKYIYQNAPVSRQLLVNRTTNDQVSQNNSTANKKFLKQLGIEIALEGASHVFKEI